MFNNNSMKNEYTYLPGLCCEGYARETSMDCEGSGIVSRRFPIENGC